MLLPAISKSLSKSFGLNQDDLVFLVENQKYMAQVYPGHDCTLIQYGALNFRVFSNGLLNEAKIIKTKQAKNSYDSRIVAPFFGRIIKINSKKGGKIKKGESLIILESMKIENHIVSPADAVVKEIKVKEGNQVKENELLVELEF